MKVAVIGSGISGLAAAHRLRAQAQVTLYEAGPYFGGHSNTLDVELPNAQGQLVSHGVDTGFLVFNERTYPGLIALLHELGVPAARSDMSFSVQVPGAGLGGQGLEWNGANLATVFAQRSNLLRPKFWRMLREVLRFNRLCTAIAQANEEGALAQPLSDFLQQHGFDASFRDWYFLPMLGCIWSCPTDQMLRFPVATMIRFCHNHGLIQVNDRPQWWTVAGGSREYVQRIVQQLPDARLQTPVQRIERDAAGVRVYTHGQVQRFDAVVLAVHSDQALRLLAQPSAQEQAVLGAIGYQPNRAVLHTDVSVMPQRRAAWAAWNYERAPSATQESARVCLHYWLNRLQPLPFAQPVLVSLNPVRSIAPDQVLAEIDYAHPVFDLAALRAQAQVPALQGQQFTWFCGAWTGYGFHEDGLRSGYAAAAGVLASLRQPAEAA
ncbi:NAD(P)/FAD-dependent oxidoreductase [Comamonas aquatica]|uniref:NAD(P)/FAD-dependent oxidoreductase n=1 Tax=Comamonas aquatica TaxID=225991 RepID=UPI002446FD58|nr:FAD-dependent oxidoreductase [Comamonas aquatica]MDH0496247.1 FAD-dependent oxidoreductase [Comamonas aquatica]MDH1676214.1 FAD-dependent oxidoreductase [Comamonas aquatica]MDH1679780.1 FAD-dependent oxidoreductase [Comamonas aquatica]